MDLLDEKYTDFINDINFVSSLLNEKNKLFYSETFGCQQNVNDTQKIEGMLLEMGYKKTDIPQKADLIFLNTCAVREHAEQRVYGRLGFFVGIKRNNPDLKIIVCGCMPQQKHSEETILKMKHVDMVFGPGAIGRFPANLRKLLTDNYKISDISFPLTEIPDCIKANRTDKLKAFVTIMNGCNNFCSYCVVPYVRGRETSRSPESILDEIKMLISEGYKEITLLGQNVNSYGNDTVYNIDFSDLLYKINDIPGNFRIRFMTSHPKDVSEKLFHTIADCEKICKHIHLPFQSGSDRILRLMNRKYTSKQYLDKIETARKIIKNVVFTSDVIVGFPTETDDDYAKTVNLVKEVKFDSLFTFIYSPRKNTPASLMEGQIDYQKANHRLSELIKIQNEISCEINKQYIGKSVIVLTEGNTKENFLTGRTDSNIIVNFSGPNESIGEFKNVIIDDAKNCMLIGHERDN